MSLTQDQIKTYIEARISYLESLVNPTLTESHELHDRKLQLSYMQARESGEDYYLTQSPGEDWSYKTYEELPPCAQSFYSRMNEEGDITTFDDNGDPQVISPEAGSSLTATPGKVGLVALVLIVGIVLFMLWK